MTRRGPNVFRHHPCHAPALPVKARPESVRAAHSHGTSSLVLGNAKVQEVGLLLEHLAQLVHLGVNLLLVVPAQNETSSRVRPSQSVQVILRRQQTSCITATNHVGKHSEREETKVRLPRSVGRIKTEKRRQTPVICISAPLPHSEICIRSKRNDCNHELPRRRGITLPLVVDARSWVKVNFRPQIKRAPATNQSQIETNICLFNANHDCMTHSQREGDGCQHFLYIGSLW